MYPCLEVYFKFHDKSNKLVLSRARLSTPGVEFCKAMMVEGICAREHRPRRTCALSRLAPENMDLDYLEMMNYIECDTDFNDIAID